jgi:hypothetical protein
MSRFRLDISKGYTTVINEMYDCGICMFMLYINDKPVLWLQHLSDPIKYSCGEILQFLTDDDHKDIHDIWDTGKIIEKYEPRIISFIMSLTYDNDKLILTQPPSIEYVSQIMYFAARGSSTIPEVGNVVVLESRFAKQKVRAKEVFTECKVPIKTTGIILVGKAVNLQIAEGRVQQFLGDRFRGCEFAYRLYGLESVRYFF